MDVGENAAGCCVAPGALSEVLLPEDISSVLCTPAFTVVLGSSFPSLLLLRLAFRCPYLQFSEGSSKASERINLQPT